MSADKEEIINQLVTVTAKWHKEALALLDDMSDAPDDKPLTLDMGGEVITLNGDDIRFFKLGIIVAMEVFRELPYKATPVDGDSRIEGD